MLTKHTYMYTLKTVKLKIKKKRKKKEKKRKKEKRTQCILRKKMQRKKSRRQEQHTRAVAVNRESFCFFFFSISEHVFTCSGGGFCPGLGEEELEVAAAGLVGLCCFAKRIRNFIILTKLNRLFEPRGTIKDSPKY